MGTDSFDLRPGQRVTKAFADHDGVLCTERDLTESTRAFQHHFEL